MRRWIRSSRCHLCHLHHLGLCKLVGIVTHRSLLRLVGKEIGDEGVSESFRKGGWSSKYPTRSLAEWEKMLADWEKRVMSPGGLGGSQGKKNRKKKGARPKKAGTKKE